jgi:hypothetical protein
MFEVRGAAVSLRAGKESGMQQRMRIRDVTQSRHDPTARRSVSRIG